MLLGDGVCSQEDHLSEHSHRSSARSGTAHFISLLTLFLFRASKNEDIEEEKSVSFFEWRLLKLNLDSCVENADVVHRPSRSISLLFQLNLFIMLTRFFIYYL